MRTVAEIFTDITKSQAKIDDLTRKVDGGKAPHEQNCKDLHTACYDRASLEAELEETKRALVQSPAKAAAKK